MRLCSPLTLEIPVCNYSCVNNLGEYCQASGGVVALAFSAGANDGALISVCTLAQIDEYTMLDVGVGLTVRGVDRVEIVEVLEVPNQPFATVKVDAFEDAEPDLPGPTPKNSNETAALEAQVESTLAAQVEALYQQDEALIAAEEAAGLASVAAAELTKDPRAILEPGQKLADVAKEVADAEAQAKKLQQQKKRSSNQTNKSSAEKKEKAGLQESVFNVVNDDPDWLPGREPAAPGGNTLRFKAAMARATQKPFGAVTAAEVKLERTMASFLALGSAGLRAKVKGFLSRDLAERLTLGADTLAEREQFLAAKQTLRSIVGSNNGSSDKESNTESKYGRSSENGSDSGDGSGPSSSDDSSQS